MAAAPTIGYGEVAEKCAGIVRAIRKRWPVMTTEASATDRVGFPGVVDIYRLYSGGTSRGVATLPVAATYRGIERDFASFITRTTEDQLSIRLYAFRGGDVEMSIVPWALAMG